MPRHTRKLSRLKLVPALALIVCMTQLHFASPASTPKHKRVLALYWYGKDFPANVEIDRGAQAALGQAGIEYYAEYFEPNRFPGEGQEMALRDYLQRKYSERKIDVVIAISPVAADFLLKYHDDLFPDAPVVFHVASRSQLLERASGKNSTGIVYDNLYARTMEAALRLYPKTQQVFAVNGTVERNKSVEALLREQFKELEKKVKITYLTDLPLNQLLARLKSLPEGALIYYARQDYEDSGRSLSIVDVSSLVAISANVPVFSMGGYVGYGVVGGYTPDLYETGVQAAKMAVQIINGVPPQDIPIVEMASYPVFDWHQLHRWGIPEENLPQGSDVRFRDPTLFEEYKWRIIGALTLCIIQSLLITGLLAERRMRRRAQAALRQRLEFETMLSELSAEFNRLPASEIDDAIDRWLHKLSRFLDGSEGHFELGEAADSANERSQSSETSAPHEVLFSATIPERINDQLFNGTVVRLLSSKRAVLNLTRRRRSQQRSQRTPVLALPISVNGSAWTLTFSAPQSHRGWPEDLLPRLRLAGEIFAGAWIRKASEEALHESQARYKLATSSGRVIVWDWDIQTSEVYADPHLKSLLGYEDYEIGNHFDDWVRLLHPDDIHFVMERIRSHIYGDATRFEAEHRFIQKGGEVRWFLASGTAVRNAQGIAVRMVGTDTDITDRKLAEQELQHLSTRLLDLQDQERQRIARELHDGTAQNIFAITINLECLKQSRVALPAKFHSAITECQTLCQQTLQEIRTLSYVLHPPILDKAGLLAALSWYLDGFGKRSGIAVELVATHNVGRLPTQVEMDLFRIVQECLANVHRHSGSRTAQVVMDRQAGQVVLKVQDQGRGMVMKTPRAESWDSRSFGVGLSGMRQRLRHLGGRLEIASDNHGTTITAIVPLQGVSVEPSTDLDELEEAQLTPDADEQCSI
jgi:PAS domain S-box-containing protein